MKSVEFVCEIFLAMVATIIAFFQWRDQLRYAKEEKKEAAKREEEKRIMQTIVLEISEIEKCTDKINEFKNIMSELSKRNDSSPNYVMQIFDETMEQYENSFKEIFPHLERLYNELLLNEERFPMSHGYGRYIADIRTILDFDLVKRQRRNNNYDKLRIEIHRLMLEAWKNNDGYLTPEVRLTIGEKTEQMVRALEPYYCHATQINSVLYELKTRYENM